VVVCCLKMQRIVPMKASLFQSFTDNVLSLLFPDRCAGCGHTGSLLCADCCARLQPYPGNGALRLQGRPEQPLFLDDVRAVFVFAGALREAIHRLKYERVHRMAAPLAALLLPHMLPADALMPVPLHPRRLAERGFNQSKLLAHHLAELSGTPMQAEGLLRCRDTAHQVGLDAHARQTNVQGAFVWRHPTPPPPRVLLVDDVLTTGATLGACALALRQAGTREVRALALARSQPESSRQDALATRHRRP
jgi:ComF family protein